MRKKGILFLLILFILIVGITLIFTDRFLENQMESLGSSAVGAKVEFDGVDFSLTTLHMKWDRLQVTDPKDTWRNLFETGRVDFDLELIPLFSKKFIIENIRIDSLRFNSKRETDGKLPRKPVSERKPPKIVQLLQKELEKESRQMPVFNLNQYTRKINIDSLWKLVDLKVPRRIDSLKNNYAEKYQTWEKRTAELPDEQDFTRLQNQIQNLKIDQIKSIEEFQSAYQTVNQVYKEADSLLKMVKTTKSDLQTDLKQVDASRKIIPQWINQDYQRALSLAKLPEISVQNAAKVLFGQQIIDKINAVSGYIGTARYYATKFSGGKPEKASPPRSKGQDIHFGSRKNLPNFWMKDFSLIVRVMNNLNIGGTIHDIVSNQNVIGKPTTIEISGVRRDGAALQLSGILDYRGDPKKEQIDLAISEMPLAGVKLTNFALLPYKIKEGRATINSRIVFEGNSLVSETRFESGNVRFDFSDAPTNMNKRLVDISRSIAQSIHTITFRAGMELRENRFKFNMSSNLDKLIADKIKEILSGEVSKARQELENRVRKEAEKYQQELQQFISEKEGALRARIDEVERRVEEQKAQIETRKKEIENRIEAEKKKLKEKVEEEAKKKLKDLFK
ncbi:MAG: hypothetical protein Kow0042_25780 [Calditrichia bacterium]